MRSLRALTACAVAVALAPVSFQSAGASGYNNWFQVVQFNLYGFNGGGQNGFYNAAVTQDLVGSLGTRD